MKKVMTFVLSAVLMGTLIPLAAAALYVTSVLVLR